MPSTHFTRSLAVLAALLAFSPTAFGDWSPSGPIKLLIGFGAGGGTDTQARNLASELEARRGWRVIPENVAGAGGAVMAASLKNEEADGLTIGLALDTTFSFASIGNDELSTDDFTYLTTLSASQTGVIARADSGWTGIDDMVEAARAGTDIVWTNYSAQTELASELIAAHYGIDVNHVRGSGGKAGVDSLVAGDANVAWGGGAQRGLVAAGELVILASAEDQPLVQAADGQVLTEMGVLPHSFGFRFVLVAPAGLPDDARSAITDAVVEVITDESSETAKFIAKQYPPAAVVVTGEELDAMIESQLASYTELKSRFAQ